MAVVLQAVSVRQLSYSLTTDSAPASRGQRLRASVGQVWFQLAAWVVRRTGLQQQRTGGCVICIIFHHWLFTPHRVIVQYRANRRFAGIDLPHFPGDLHFSGGGGDFPPKYGLNKTLCYIYAPI